MNQEYAWKRCVIYTRVSSSMQLEKWNGLQSQEIICRERAKNNWVEVVAIFSDWWVSGKYSSREWLDNMIEFLKDQNKTVKNIDLVISDDMDRLIRDLEWWFIIKREIEIDCKAEIQTVKQKLENSNEWILMQNLVMAMKQYERQNNATRVKSRQRWRMLDWYWVFTAPTWYSYQWKWRDKKLERTDDAPIIKEALELYSEWGFKSDREMCLYINDKLPHISIKWAEKLLLHNRLIFYAGIIDYPKYDIHMVKGQHEPIISLSTLEQIESRKKKKVSYKDVSKDDISEKMLLRHFLICPSCWKPYTWWPSKNKYWKFYYYYRCVNPQCTNNKSYNINKVHEEFWELLKTFEIKDSTIKCFKIILWELFENEKTVLIRDSKTQKAEIKEIDNKIKKLVDLITECDNQEIQATYQNKLAELTLKKTTLLERVSSSTNYDDITLDWLFDFTLPLLKSPYKLRSSWDPKIMQLVPSVVIWAHFLYSENIKFTTPRDSSIYADFLDKNFQKSLSLEVRRIELRSKRHTHHVLPL